MGRNAAGQNKVQAIFPGAAGRKVRFKGHDER